MKYFYRANAQRREGIAPNRNAADQALRPCVFARFFFSYAPPRRKNGKNHADLFLLICGNFHENLREKLFSSRSTQKNPLIYFTRRMEFFIGTVFYPKCTPPLALEGGTELTNPPELIAE